MRAISSLKLFSALCVLSAFIAASAQTDAHATAQRVAQQVDQHYNQLRSLSAHFDERYSGLGMERSESGTLLLRKPGQMKWLYQSSPGKYFLLSGKFAYFYAPGDTQIQRIPASQLDDLRSPLRFLLGHTKLESELTNLSLSSAPNGQYTLTGIPKGQQKRIAALTLTVTATGAINVIDIHEQDGSETRFTLTDQSENPAFPPDTFRFTPPAGIPVSDALPPA